MGMTSVRQLLATLISRPHPPCFPCFSSALQNLQVPHGHPINPVLNIPVEYIDLVRVERRENSDLCKVRGHWICLVY